MKFLNENTVKTNKDGKDGVQDENDKNSSESGKFRIFLSERKNILKPLYKME